MKRANYILKLRLKPNIELYDITQQFKIFNDEYTYKLKTKGKSGLWIYSEEPLRIYTEKLLSEFLQEIEDLGDAEFLGNHNNISFIFSDHGAEGAEPNDQDKAESYSEETKGLEAISQENKQDSDIPSFIQGQNHEQEESVALLKSKIAYLEREGEINKQKMQESLIENNAIHESLVKQNIRQERLLRKISYNTDDGSGCLGLIIIIIIIGLLVRGCW